MVIALTSPKLKPDTDLEATGKWELLRQVKSPETDSSSLMQNGVNL